MIRIYHSLRTLKSILVINYHSKHHIVTTELIHIYIYRSTISLIISFTLTIKYIHCH